MPMYDRICGMCETTHIDCFEPMNNNGPIPCPVCGGDMVRRCVAIGKKAAGVIDDNIPGGVLIKHGICNADGSPRRFDSKTEIRRAAKEAGWVWGGNETKHVPMRGSDKSPHTTRWI